MPLDLDRIRQLAAEEDDSIPPMTTAQAQDVLRLLGTKPAGQARFRAAS
jgi:hypothetical protein